MIKCENIWDYRSNKEEQVQKTDRMKALSEIIKDVSWAVSKYSNKGLDKQVQYKALCILEQIYKGAEDNL